MNYINWGAQEIEFSEGLPVETQQYNPYETKIEGCIIETIKVFKDHEGQFSELMKRTTPCLNVGFVAQINYSVLPPRVLKGWHVHKKQTDVWFIPPGNVCNIGLWDIRKGSKTEGAKYILKVNNTVENFFKITIPEGVAHGIQSLTYPVNMLYCVTEEFNPNEPDEYRLPAGLEIKDGEEKFWD